MSLNEYVKLLVSHLSDIDSLSEATFDIWGSCVSRDVLGITSNSHSRYKINKYYSRCVPFLQFSTFKGLNSKIKLSIEDYSDTGMHNFLKRVVVSDFNKDITPNLEQSNADWLIVDFRSIFYGIKKISWIDNEEGEQFVYITGNNIGYVTSILNKKVSTTIEDIDLNSLDFEDAFHQFTEFCKLRYGSNIILIDSKEVYNYLNNYGDVDKKWNLDGAIALEEYLNYLFMKETSCYFVKCPLNAIADSYHKWRLNSVHYLEEYYWYARKSIDIIVKKGAYSSIYYELEKNYINAIIHFSEIRSKTLLSANHTIERCNSLIKEENYDEAIELLNKMIAQNEPRAFYLMARLYRDGCGIEIDLEKSLELMKIAANYGNIRAVRELFDIYWKFNDSNMDIQMIDNIMPYATGLAKDGHKIAVDPACSGRLARAYMQGRGVPQNLALAAQYMRIAANAEIIWGKRELFDILWEINTPQTDKEMVDIIRPLAENDDLKSLARLSKAYQYGRGVPQDYFEALKLLRKAVDSGQISSTTDLIYLLWEVNTPETDKEMIDRANIAISNGKIRLKKIVEKATLENRNYLTKQ